MLDLLQTILDLLQITCLLFIWYELGSTRLRMIELVHEMEDNQPC